MPREGAGVALFLIQVSATATLQATAAEDETGSDDEDGEKEAERQAQEEAKHVLANLKQ